MAEGAQLLSACTINLLPRDGEMYFLGDAIAPAAATFADLRAAIPWRQEMARVMGRVLPTPRLTAWFGEAGYRYSGIDHRAAAMPECLRPLKAQAEKLAGCQFNSVLLNLYRNGRDSVSWHCDNERGLGPVIASISLGATRRFRVRHRHDARLWLALDLTAGSCLIMAGGMQQSWLHCVPKQPKVAEERINLTFRQMGAAD